MRVKQTARKSTGQATSSQGSFISSASARSGIGFKREPSESDSSQRPSTSSSSSFRRNDPVESRLSNLLTTKKQTPGSQGKKIHDTPLKIKPRSRPGESVLREITRLRKTSDLQIPRQPFHRLVREITECLVRQSHDPERQIRYQSAALEAMQEAAETYLTQLFEDSYLLTRHAGRVTLFAKDIHLCRHIQGARYLL